MARKGERRLVIVSNRLPVVMEHNDTGWFVRPSSGGLVTALAPVLRDRGGIWIGWPGTSSEIDLTEPLAIGTRTAGYSLKPVSLTPQEVQNFYFGFANEVIWPLFHDLQGSCNFDPDYWATYQEVNFKYAEVTAETAGKGDYIWVHDYHLMCLGRALRQLGVNSLIGFFLHIPFPPLDIFLKLPWRFQILRALLEFDLIGLQTLRDYRNFLQCIRAVIKDVRVQLNGRIATIRFGERGLRVGAFPISIDYKAFAREAVSEEVTERSRHIHEELPKRHIVLGVDRLDYTKGIPHKLDAFRRLLTQHPELREQITLVQVVVPSRETIPKYQDLKMEIERMVGEINGLFTVWGWAPIIYIFRSLDRDELIAYYRASEIALVTPLKDGMNLVSKEFCASSVEEECVLILSEFAGAAAQLQNGALLVNPYDTELVADAIHRAFSMNRVDRKYRMHKLRKKIRENDVFHWVDSFLKAAIGRDLHEFPPLEDYLPQVELDAVSYRGETAAQDFLQGAS
ncbi:MAG: trehalose-6-phosphate synthase [Desulfomonile tiedjei]|uniref:Glucosylglycerol-phosphate synthase n=1 Tax=Desulfomonile tiedjei TaxID=2358 RepID=A0A9D6V1K7_9BACT|nr:trehalose-6-phosphate synthase [Desulfomonile tiedjei]